MLKKRKKGKKEGEGKGKKEEKGRKKADELCHQLTEAPAEFQHEDATEYSKYIPLRR